MNYDDFLESKRAERYDSPQWFKECCYCGYCFDPDDLIESCDVAERLDDLIQHEDVVTVLIQQIMSDEDLMCPDCVKQVVTDYKGGLYDEDVNKDNCNSHDPELRIDRLQDKTKDLLGELADPDCDQLRA